jgi:hypothetical protein
MGRRRNTHAQKRTFIRTPRVRRLFWRYLKEAVNLWKANSSDLGHRGNTDYTGGEGISCPDDRLSKRGWGEPDSERRMGVCVLDCWDSITGGRWIILYQYVKQVVWPIPYNGHWGLTTVWNWPSPTYYAVVSMREISVFPWIRLYVVVGRCTDVVSEWI